MPPLDHDAAAGPSSSPPSDRARLRRAHQRGAYDRDAIDAVLDAGMLCHVAYVLDGAPVVTPTLYWREGDHVYWHGSSASRMLRQSESAPVCLSVTHFDGLVVARSAFHHSANFRSAMLFGTAEKVTDPVAKTAHLQRFMDGIFPGRWAGLRPMTDAELKATTVLRLSIDEAAAKVRAGGPIDDEEDYTLPIWAGVIPMRTVFDAPIDDPRLCEATGPLPHAALVDPRLDTPR